MDPSLRVLFVEDSADDAELAIEVLNQGGFDVVHKLVCNAESLQHALKNESWDVVICDYSMIEIDCWTAFSIFREQNIDVPFIITSGAVGEEIAVEAMRMGAHDYLLKDRLGRLAQVVRRELSQADNRHRLKEKEQQFLQAQKMEIVGRLSGGVAHDFNNILSVVLLYCDSIVARRADSEMTLKDVEQIKQAVERATALTRQLLTFSKIQPLQAHVVNVNPLISHLEKLLMRLIGEDIELIIELDAELATIEIVPSHFEQIIMNLVVNSRDAMPKGGRLIIRTANVTVPNGKSSYPSHVLPGAYVKISVTDTGCGMDKETQARIFEPFFTTKASNSGTGLGLSTVYNIVDQNRGHIVVNSCLSEGTTFDIYLPKSNSPSNQVKDEAIAAKPAKSLRGKTILLLEDEVELRNILCKLLEANEGQVLNLVSPQDVLAYLEKQNPDFDLLVSDVVMPGMNGTDLVRRLVAKLPHLKVLLISGYLDYSFDDFQEFHSRVHFLQKPFSSERLIAKVTELLSGQAVAS